MRTISLVVFITFFTVNIISCSQHSNKEDNKNFNAQIGFYVLDLKKTKLGIYNKDSDYYKRLSIVFKNDSTFKMNMRVPFIYDSVGTWQPAGNGLEDWASIYFKNSNIDVQVENCCEADSTFYFNSTTPQKGAVPVYVVYFKKK